MGGSAARADPPPQTPSRPLPPSGSRTGYSVRFVLIRHMVGAVLCAAVLAAPTAAPAAVETPSWVEEFNKRQAREATERSEREAKEAAERKERETKEAAEQRAKQEAPPAPAQPGETNTAPSGATVHCVVPSLKDHSLSATRRLLVRAHCTLGKVNRPQGGHRMLVVTAQNPAHGMQLPDEATVAVWLRPAKHHDAR